MFDVKIALSNSGHDHVLADPDAGSWFHRVIENLIIRIGSRWLYQPVGR